LLDGGASLGMSLDCRQFEDAVLREEGCYRSRSLDVVLIGLKQFESGFHGFLRELEID
jgi:hypothetical protein